MENVKKEVTPSKSKAFGFSFLVCLAEAIVYAIVYALGYYAYIIPIAGVLFAMIVFHKFSKDTWQSVLVNFFWCILWTIAFNIVAVLVANALSLCELGYTIFTAFPAMITLLQTEPEALSIVVNAIITSTLITVFCGVIGLVYFIINNKNKKKNANNETGTTNADSDRIDVIYFRLYSSAKQSIEKYNEGKDKEVFKAEIGKLKEGIANMPIDTRNAIQTKIEQEAQKENLTDTDKKIFEVLNNLINPVLVESNTNEENK